MVPWNARTPETAALAVQIAVVHLLFNVSAITMLFPIAVIREIPLRGARWLANLAVRSKKMAILYLIGMFYVLPALLVAATTGS